MVRVNIMALRCPACSSDLVGLSQDAMFYCAACHRGYEPLENGFTQHVIATVIPRNVFDSGKLFWAPFWLFDVTVKVDAKPTETRRAEEIISQHPRVWVSAFRMWRPTYFGNPGYLYTSNRISPDLDEKRDPPILIGCSLGRQQASELVKPFMLSVIDRRVDVAFIDITCEITGARLLAVPFSLKDDKVKDTQINWEYSSMMFEDLPNLVNLGT